jgi:hypothetical protein
MQATRERGGFIGSDTARYAQYDGSILKEVHF